MEKTKFYLVQRDKYKWESMLQKIGFKAADDLGESRCDTIYECNEKNTTRKYLFFQP